MGYEVSQRRVYAEGERYCNGSGLAMLVSDRAEAEARFAQFARNDAGYQSACFLIDLPTGNVLRSTGALTMAEVNRRMFRAARAA